MSFPDISQLFENVITPTPRGFSSLGDNDHLNIPPEYYSRPLYYIRGLSRSWHRDDFPLRRPAWAMDMVPQTPVTTFFDQNYEIFIKNLSNKQYKIKIKKEQFSCSICLCDEESNEQNNIIQIKKCHHIFHKDCIIKWFKTNKKSCPMCRTIL